MNPANPLISIIIPIYNVQDYLEQCLHSVAHQTYKNLEIVCVIDGSQDNSENIARHFSLQDPRCQILTQPNRGLSVARNRGVEHASGDWIFFLDADDWLAEDAIENLFATAEKTKMPVISGAVMEHWEETGTIRPYKKRERRSLGHIHLLRQNFFALEPMVWNKLYKRDLVVNTPFTPGLVHEDLDFYWRLFPQYPEVYAIAETVIHYRCRSGTLSKQKKYDDSYQDNYIRILDNAFLATRHHRSLGYYVFRQSLKYLKYLKKKSAPSARYEQHIWERYGVRDNWRFRLWLTLKRLF